jgi:hypothetical protein
MSKLTNYNGSIELIAGVTQKNGLDFPLIEAHAVLVDESGTRLDEKLQSIGGSTGGSGLYVLELNDIKGTLTDEQYAALVANAPNVVCKVANNGDIIYVPLTVKYGDGSYGFLINIGGSFNDDELPFQMLMLVVVDANKRYGVVLGEKEIATKSYVDDLFGSYITDIDALVGGGM